MIEFFMVDVKDIQVPTTDQNFPPSVIEDLANTILASEGLIKPLILKKISLQNYQLIDGHLEYYAALQAKAKDPRKGEMVNAFVISADQEYSVAQQITVLQSAHSFSHHAQTNPATIPEPTFNNLPMTDLSVTDYTQLEIQLNTKLNNYSQAIQNQLRQNQEDLQLALEKMQNAWEATLNRYLQQQKEEIQAQLRSLSLFTSPVTVPSKISDPLSEVREKTPMTKNGLSPEKVNTKININEVKTIQDFKKLKKQYAIPDLGDARITAIIDFRQERGGRIESLAQLAEAGSGISQTMINKWSRYFTC